MRIVLESGKPIAQVARDLGIYEARWATRVGACRGSPAAQRECGTADAA